MGSKDDDNHMVRFKDDVEKIFQNAETEISGDTFRFEAAKGLVTIVRQHVESYTTQGCPEADLEAAVLERALKTASTLVAGVQENKEEIYDPRQTLVYLCSALSVSSLSLSIVSENGRVVYKLSVGGRKCLTLIEQLHIYCITKGSCEDPITEVQNLIWLSRLLVNLAFWVERTRPHTSYYIVSLVNRHNIVPYIVIPQMRQLYSAALVVVISSWLRMEHQQHYKEFHRLLTRGVNVADLSAQYVVRYNIVYAKLLYSCRRFTNALDRARDALSDSQDDEERREIEELITQLESALSQPQDDDAENEIDEDWLTDTNISQGELSARQVEEARFRYRPTPKHKRRRRSSITYALRSRSLERIPVTAGGKHDAQECLPGNLPLRASAVTHRLNESTPDLRRVGSFVDTSDNDSSTPEPPTYSSESETENDDEEEKPFRIGYDDDEEEPVDDVLSEEPVSTVVDDGKDWFEKSVEDLKV
ncbi:hypothetical protein C0Q70_16391 [Pomacea canaliculata]|uniref:Uncharacterized protein n=1 Tax=Pomacea canaliculata TaxID=400727 RepID=A0A2T7NPN5_POMCA|nr:uncharacterized protein LOC112573503 [Pomacea canaliculata]XP_025109730.1 uncharacterized protein LOC112573503 [Pomacea canaliculata]XP_025109731.1 uncharacterized protein LOC112573503 [Pomacea canaliculata]XP_025109732.1 uncharacterized protein LOC112573503 [Pomacea canaliculata]XP_025109733.1 uncharacterized protein LOC112573503 [Pomacea canaliculata]XP_025109734.1 uncharacterized protein LOC112573503 [Pomacea canaliculata]XP_025109735.1 uncharacterized protein LOC112573503 [Pomacea cana